MIQVSLDTSFLITFADPERPNHAVAVEYFRYCLAQRIPLWISTVVAGEFEVKEPISDLPLQNFRIQPYNLAHAIKAAALYRTLHDETTPVEGQRSVIINDLKVIAQAEEEQIPVVITEDANTLVRIATRLRQRGGVTVNTILLKEGFTPGRLENPAQSEFQMPSGSA